jgi:glutathione peroxidase
MNLLYNTLLFSLFFSYYTMSSFQISESANIVGDMKSIYDVEINDIDDNKINLKDFKEKKILFVNVASKCGFTKQYKELEELHQLYKDKLIIIGLPCNQFGEQEPGSHSEIKEFCQKNYGVTFLISEKIKVKGDGIHPLYKWLTNKELNGVSSSTVKWNFQKYIIDEKGGLIDVFYSATNPLSKKIQDIIKN